MNLAAMRFFGSHFFDSINFDKKKGKGKYVFLLWNLHVNTRFSRKFMAVIGEV